MNRNHFIFAWAGNKRNEAPQIVPFMKLNDIDTFVEPYCGSSAISVYLSNTNYGNNKKIKYILNDNDKQLIEIYNILKDDNEIINLEKQINDIIGDKDFNEAKYYELTAKDDLISYILQRTIYYRRIGLFNNSKIRKHKTNVKYIGSLIQKFMQSQNTELHNKNAIDIIKENIDNDKCIIYLDPPYLKTRNKDYYKNIDNYESIYTYLRTLKDVKCKIYLSILLNDDLINSLPNFKVINKYDKVYCWGNKRVQSHVLMYLD
jgi:site-specific DNA-adenine methylase